MDMRPVVRKFTINDKFSQAMERMLRYAIFAKKWDPKLR